MRTDEVDRWFSSWMVCYCYIDINKMEEFCQAEENPALPFGLSLSLSFPLSHKRV